MSNQYAFFADPGHGWLRVTLAELDRLGIAGQISHYSYQHNQFAYLEEDCDLTRFIEAKTAIGELVDIDTHYGNGSSRIRSYPTYRKG